MQIIGIVLAIIYGVVGIAQGLAQQRSGLASSEVDCPYRVKLIRDRVVALTLRTPALREGDPQDRVVLNLIRETQDACTADAASTQALDTIEGHLRAHMRDEASETEIRRELLAP